MAPEDQAWRLIVAALSGLLLAGCATDSDDDRPLGQGTFVGTSEVDEQGAYAQVTVTIDAGDVVDAELLTVQADGSLKDEDYGRTADGEIANEDFYEAAQDAVAAFEVYAAQLVDGDDPDEVDVVAGATLSHGQFVEAAEAALDASRDQGASDEVGQG